LQRSARDEVRAFDRPPYVEGLGTNDISPGRWGGIRVPRSAMHET